MSRYLVAIAAPAVAIVLRLFLNPVLGDGNVAYITLFIAMVFVGWFGGIGPSIVALLFSVVGAVVFLIPQASPVHGWSNEFASLVVFAIMGSACAVLGYLVAREARRAELNGELALSRESALKREIAERIAAESQLRVITEHAAVLIANSDRQGNYKYVNRPYAQRFGVSPSELVGKRIVDVVGSEAFAKIYPHHQRALSGELVEFEAEIPYSIGRQFMHCAYTPERDANGNIVGVIAAVVNISDRKRAEDALRASEARLASQARALELALGGSSLDEIFAHVVTAAREQVQGSRTALLLKSRDSSQLCHASSAGLSEEYQHAFNELPMTHDGPSCVVAAYTGDIEIVHDVMEDERWRSMREHTQKNDIRACWSFPLRSSGGAVPGVLVVYLAEPSTPTATDIESLNLLAQTLALIIERHEANEASERRARQLREADRHKDEFLATLAHELRNPLAPLRSGLQVMQLAPDDKPTVERARAMMERQVTHMVHLIDDLLDVSRISRGKIELRKKIIDVGSVVQHAVETSRPIIDAGQHRLEIQLPPLPLYIDADSTRIAQVLANLLNNAAKFSPKGGHITLSVTATGDTAELSVADQGIGIEPSSLSTVFELFTQVDQSLERTKSGLGIGLSIVRGLVELHGGTVEARSEGPGRGSVFIVRLPLAERSLAHPGENGTSPLKGASVKRRILVVDDNLDATSIMELMLQHMGHVTRSASDGVEALDAAEEFRPDVMLMDIGMPRMNGYDAARAIREQPWGKDTVLVALTGWGQEEDRKKSLDAGFNYHLVKPVDFQDLRKLLESIPGQPAT